MPGRTSELTSCQLTLPAFCSTTQKPASPSGVLMFDFFKDLSMSMPQAFSADLLLMVALLSMPTKSSTSATSKWSKQRVSVRRLFVTGMPGVNSCSRSACIFTNATIVSLENRIQSSTNAGLYTVGDCIGIGTSSNRVTVCVQNRVPMSSFRRSTVSYFAFSHACQSRRVSSLKEDSVLCPPIPFSICQAMSCGCLPRALASSVMIFLQYSQYTLLFMQ